MTWKSIRRCGKVKEFHKKIPLSTGKIKTGEFLFEMMEEFAKVATRDFDTIGDLSFSYKERQLSSIFLPAFYNLGFGAMQEIPTRRKDLEDNCSAGWLDYWVQKEDKWVYLIEVKHAWQFLNGTVTKDTLNKISASAEQLRKINGEALEELSMVETTFKVSLIVLPIYRAVPASEEVEIYEEYVTPIEELDDFIGNKFVDEMLREAKEEVSWIGVWSLPERMQFSYERSYASTLGTYPGVILIATLIAD